MPQELLMHIKIHVTSKYCVRSVEHNQPIFAIPWRSRAIKSEQNLVLPYVGEKAAHNK